MRLRAKIGMLATAALVVVGLAIGFMPRAVPVDVAEVKRAPLTVTVEEEGKTRVRERYLVSAPVAGYARRIDLKAGDAVAAGQVLAVIEPARPVALDPRTRVQAQAQVSAAQAALAAAQENARAAAAAAQLAQQERVRAESLRQSNFVSAQALDAARTAETRARAAEQAAQYAVRVARFDLETARAAAASAAQLQRGGTAEALQVQAPVAARVLRVQHESEGPVAAGQSLLEIGNPESLEAEVEVLSTDAVKIATGSKVVLDRWGGNPPIEGRVRVVEPGGFTKISALGVEEQRVRVIVDFTSPREAWARLGDGYRVEARFVLWQGKDVLQLPSSALFRNGEGWAAFRLEGSRARLTPVEIGQRAGLATQVLSGLKAGDRVVAHPDETIREGVRVKPR
ncbi:MAG: HlyD family efflux transporter periplasmic adaptor subunit [Thiobacillus sp.]|uniref:efflux RND transporter periplasmic adaptor subunit n=1 Tax=unclassified Thiobacillus TaxID=2646513 RepID=UPI0009595BD1|nr:MULTISPECIES: HlyD family efflux transporter periplasmic adaptor subunit [unclassified Thiobacillus]MBN8771352.1 HlyD family efflux transporter periplasmic adaptor subunit [Thiobacillus sp.]MBN8780705.1 HlyD family efflux transporter periplasmic adaptor subunit [Thiobacillus sp.]OJY57877.1 MAG: efflux transporter periplasmic adaptor subunit [Thiobacillus sp. 0-1251]